MMRPVIFVLLMMTVPLSSVHFEPFETATVAAGRCLCSTASGNPHLGATLLHILRCELAVIVL